ncbi:hypothetical protein Tco_0014417 [Tanacetum coccineum]
MDKEGRRLETPEREFQLERIVLIRILPQLCCRNFKLLKEGRLRIFVDGIPKGSYEKFSWKWDERKENPGMPIRN